MSCRAVITMLGVLPKVWFLYKKHLLDRNGDIGRAGSVESEEDSTQRIGGKFRDPVTRSQG